jgi:hypothetical protein
MNGGKPFGTGKFIFHGCLHDICLIGPKSYQKTKPDAIVAVDNSPAMFRSRILPLSWQLQQGSWAWLTI